MGTKDRSVEKIASIIGNRPLASAIHSSVTSALRHSFVHLVHGKTTWDVFKRSLDAAIRDIEQHPRGKLFRRLIEYGPHNPDEPEALTSDSKTTLSDPESGSCIEFIYSHMVNRFKGELAELLALDPCITLIQRLYQDGQLFSGIHLYWGELVQERYQNRITSRKRNARWGSFTKGADGLLVEKGKFNETLKIHGIIEVKSMTRSPKRVLDQINSHIMRLSGGIKLGTREWLPVNIRYARSKNSHKNDSGLIRIMVVPSTWKLSREWHYEKTDKGRVMVFPEPSEPQIRTQIAELEPSLWKITLAWSQEALNQAAHEMTFWYMSQVGDFVWAKKSLPRGWEYMTPEQAGYNAIKEKLYYILLRYISKRQGRLATRLYNVYCFGYPLGADSKEMLWPEDFPDKDGPDK